MDDQFEEVIKLRNLYKALKKACASSMWKEGTTQYRWDALRNCARRRRELLDGTYKLQRYPKFKIYRPKPRDITATRVGDRHVQRSACDQALYPKMTRSFIYDNGACQVGKGVDFTLERMKTMLRREYVRQKRQIAKERGIRHEEVGPFKFRAIGYKGDIKKYFPSSLYSVAKQNIRAAIESERLAAFFCAIVESFGEDYWTGLIVRQGVEEDLASKAATMITEARTEREFIPLRPEERRCEIAANCERDIVNAISKLPGLSREQVDYLIHEVLHGDARGIALGSQPSQILQLYQISPMDHWIKENAKVSVYSRYNDDYVIYDPDEGKVRAAVDASERFLASKGLEVNPKSRYIDLANGLVYLKWRFIVTDTGKIIMRPANGVIPEEKRVLRRMYRKCLEKGGDMKSLLEHYQGWRAHIARGNTYLTLRSMDKYVEALMGGDSNGKH